MLHTALIGCSKCRVWARVTDLYVTSAKKSLPEIKTIQLHQFFKISGWEQIVLVCLFLALQLCGTKRWTRNGWQKRNHVCLYLQGATLYVAIQYIAVHWSFLHYCTSTLLDIWKSRCLSIYVLASSSSSCFSQPPVLCDKGHTVHSLTFWVFWITKWQSSVRTCILNNWANQLLLLLFHKAW